MAYTFPAAMPHGELSEILPGVHLVTGTVAMPGRVPVRFSRNMTVIVEGDRVVLVNSVRLDDAGLAKLEKLGRVTDVVRLAANHGRDDPFYADRYGAKVWAVNGQRYTSGFDTSKAETYWQGHTEMDATTALPLTGARLYVIASRPNEGMLLLDRHDGVLVSGDCLQHWATTDPYFNFFGGIALRMMGFIKPYNIGPGWLKQCKPPQDHLRGLLDLPFTHVLPAHGAAVIGGAKEKFRPAIAAVS